MDAFLRLLRNFILLSLPLILISVWTGLNPMGYMSAEYPMWAEEKEAVNNDVFDREINTLIIGDSRAKSGIVPSLLSDYSYNIAIGGATSIEMYYAVRNYLETHAAPETALVIFAPYHFCDIDNWEQALYYNYLSFPEIMEAELNAVKYSEKKIDHSGKAADMLSFKLRLPNKYLDAVYSARFNGNRDANIEKYALVRRERGYTAFGEEEYNDGVNYETHHPDFDLSPMADAYYNRLLTLLKENGVKVIIEQCPINEASDAVISEEFRQGFDEYMKVIEGKYEDFTVEREIPVYPNSYFGDNNHMNRKGAEKYTEEVRKKYGFTISDR